MNPSILQRIHTGDRSAVRECVLVYGSRVWSLARRFTATPADAEDAVQEVFMAIWKSAGSFDPDKAQEGTFVTMIARRRLIDGLRKAPAPAQSLEQLPDLMTLKNAGGDHSVENSVEAAKVSEVLSGFASPQREVITMAIYGGYSHSAIAEKLELPLGTAKTLLRRGLNSVREALNIDQEMDQEMNEEVAS